MSILTVTETPAIALFYVNAGHVQVHAQGAPIGSPVFLPVNGLDFRVLGQCGYCHGAVVASGYCDACQDNLY